MKLNYFNYANFNLVQVRKLLLCTAALYCSLTSAKSVSAGLQPGDLLVNDFWGSVHHYRENGTFVQTLASTGNRSEGVAVTNDGGIATTFREPYVGISLFSSVGTETTFATPTVEFPGDFSIFSDGSIAINDQKGPSVELYSSTGSFISSIPIPLQNTLNVTGSDVDSSDTLWVTLLSSRTVLRFDKSGEELLRFSTAFTPGDIVVDEFDNTLWIPDAQSDVLYHLTSDGSVISSFETDVTARLVNFQGVVMAKDRTLFVTSSESERVFRYTTNGELLESFSLPQGASPLFLEVVAIPEPSTAGLLTSLVLGFAGMPLRIYGRTDTRMGR